jgi:hypothetical protein
MAKNMHAPPENAPRPSGRRNQANAAVADSPLTGGCQCGAVRYEVIGAPLELYICHCQECRKQSSSAFGISVIVRRRDLQPVQGNVARWSRPADSGHIIDCYFCPNCGSRVWHGDRNRDDTVSIKGGSLDKPIDLTDAVHIWTARKLQGVVIPGAARHYPGEPG